MFLGIYQVGYAMRTSPEPPCAPGVPLPPPPPPDPVFSIAFVEFGGDGPPPFPAPAYGPPGTNDPLQAPPTPLAS